jgi:tetratricopeptide (TPR) repeat protein
MTAGGSFHARPSVSLFLRVARGGGRALLAGGIVVAVLARPAHAEGTDGALLTPSSREERPGTAYSATAMELTRQGREHAERGDLQVAIHRFVEAIKLDGTYGPAYLELAVVRERTGDWLEAEHTYDVAIERLPQFAVFFRARAALHGKLGQADRELADLEAASRLSDAPDVLSDLAQSYIKARAWPAALAVYRKYLAQAQKLGDERALHDASVHVRALAILCGELDPVALGATSRDWVRRAEASVARRLGI